MSFGSQFRPWGPLAWLLPRLSASKWSILGCISAEDRSLQTWRTLEEQESRKQTMMFEIHDEHPNDEHHSRFYARTETKILDSRQTFLKQGGIDNEIRRFYLADVYGQIINAAYDFVTRGGPNIIVDISSLPKRFFFPILKRVLNVGSAKNIIATYTVPEKYTDDQLAEDPAVKSYLPMFLPPYPEPDDHVSIVGLGYEPLGVKSVMDAENLELLFPFPSLPPGTRRNWAFVRELALKAPKNLHRVYVYDVSETFDRIMALTNGASRYAVLAPFGPKPMSLAMCLYAISAHDQGKHASVFYTQPRVYNPDYSTGVKIEGGVPKVLVYCVRLKGKNLY